MAFAAFSDFKTGHLSDDEDDNFITLATLPKKQDKSPIKKRKGSESNSRKSKRSKVEYDADLTDDDEDIDTNTTRMTFSIPTLESDQYSFTTKEFMGTRPSFKVLRNILLRKNIAGNKLSKSYFDQFVKDLLISFNGPDGKKVVGRVVGITRWLAPYTLEYVDEATNKMTKVSTSVGLYVRCVRSMSYNDPRVKFTKCTYNISKPLPEDISIDERRKAIQSAKPHPSDFIIDLRSISNSDIDEDAYRNFVIKELEDGNRVLNRMGTAFLYAEKDKLVKAITAMENASTEGTGAHAFDSLIMMEKKAVETIKVLNKHLKEYESGEMGPVSMFSDQISDIHKKIEEQKEIIEEKKRRELQMQITRQENILKLSGIDSSVINDNARAANKSKFTTTKITVSNVASGVKQAYLMPENDVFANNMRAIYSIDVNKVEIPSSPPSPPSVPLDKYLVDVSECYVPPSMNYNSIKKIKHKLYDNTEKPVEDNYTPTPAQLEARRVEDKLFRLNSLGKFSLQLNSDLFNRPIDQVLYDNLNQPLPRIFPLLVPHFDQITTPQMYLDMVRESEQIPPQQEYQQQNTNYYQNQSQSQQYQQHGYQH